MPYNETILRKDESDSLLLKKNPYIVSLTFLSDGEKLIKYFFLFNYWHTLETASIIFIKLS